MVRLEWALAASRWLLCLLQLLVPCALALAEPPAAPAAAGDVRTSSLGWVRLPGAETCIATHELAQRVEQRLGRRAFASASVADIALEGRVEHDDKGQRWHATLVMSDRRGRILGKRELSAEGDDCSALDEPLTLVIAIAIDPGIALSGDEAEELSPQVDQMLSDLQLEPADSAGDESLLEAQLAGEPAGGGARGVAASGGDDDRRGRPPGSLSAGEVPTTTIELSLRGTALLGALPGVSPGLGLVLTLEPPDFLALELGIEGFVRHGLAAGDGEANFELVAAVLGACPLSLALREQWRWDLCAGGRLGALLSSGRDFQRDQSPAGVWGELLLYSALSWGLDDLFLQLGAALGAPLVRDSFYYSDRQGELQLLHRPAAVSGRLWLGAGVRFR